MIEVITRRLSGGAAVKEPGNNRLFSMAIVSYKQPDDNRLTKI